jgi:hypothetical protein
MEGGGGELSDPVVSSYVQNTGSESPNSHIGSEYGGMSTANGSNDEPVTVKRSRVPPSPSEVLYAGPSYSPEVKHSSQPVESCSSKSTQPKPSLSVSRSIITPTHDQSPTSPVRVTGVGTTAGFTHLDNFNARLGSTNNSATDPLVKPVPYRFST